MHACTYDGILAVGDQKYGNEYWMNRPRIRLGVSTAPTEIFRDPRQNTRGPRASSDVPAPRMFNFDAVRA